MAIRDDLAGNLLPSLQEVIDYFCGRFGKDALVIQDFEATGVLLKAIVRKHGDQALQAIEEYFGQRGARNAELIRAEIPDTSLKSLKEFFISLTQTGDVELTDVLDTEERFAFTVPCCPVGYGEKMLDQKVCDKMMAMDRKMVETISAGKLVFETIKGPPNCRNILRKAK